MSVGLSRSKRKTRPGERLLTVADLAALPDDLPSGPVKYELHLGRLVVMPPPGDTHGAVQCNIGAELKFQGERRGHGKARTEVGVILGRDPDHVLGPDVVFIASAALPIRTSPEGDLETIPDLAVEIRSKNDTLKEIQDKINEYLRAGVRVVWVADPAKQTVTAYRRGKRPQVFKATDTLTIEDVIPGFRMSVAEVFQV